ncbi:nucleoside transporter family [Moelleriella libera RCEF 2490]|uniref:Nucleoside transporter family n=1 Tax=Moelleriella libera RCEF 2490 TaxID=1081109 RepID=A0A162IVG5_9HYPO|nr:nucleoside transporter family [Moelleriella libera RCEF 2490]
MFLAAAPYFASRFAGRDAWIQTNFQSGILAVSTITNLGALLVLSNIQHAASYPLRISLALLINVLVFALLTASTAAFLDASPAAYFAFLLAMVACSSYATALIQNGAFAFAASYGRAEYMQALMAGQGVAGVLPAVAQVVTVLLFPPPTQVADDHHGDYDTSAGVGAAPKAPPSFSSSSPPPPPPPAPPPSSYSAFFYFLAAVTISLVALVALIPLVQRHNRRLAHKLARSYMAEPLDDTTADFASAPMSRHGHSNSEDEPHPVITAATTTTPSIRKVTSLWLLFRKLRWLAIGVATTFAITMFFPVFTAKIHSVRESTGDIVFRPEAFIPLGFVFWNTGDLLGRLSTIAPVFASLRRRRPLVLFLLALARVLVLPLYLLCNINGKGAVIESDFFYLFVVQILFGWTNGWLGSTFMMAAGEWVDEREREATGGFMGLCLVIGLTVGSLLSFTVSGI